MNLQAIPLTVIDGFGKPVHAWADERPDIVAPGDDSARAVFRLRPPVPALISSWLYPDGEGDLWFRGHAAMSPPV